MNINGLVLAAGLSKRMHIFKPSIVLENGLTILENTINSMNNLCNKIVVVGGYKIDIIKEIVKRYPKVTLVYNKNFEKSMFLSVKLGVQNISSQRFFVIPGDCPFIKPKTFEILSEFNSDIVIPRYKNKNGHPVLIQSKLIEEIINYPEESNLHEFINNHKHLLIDVNDEGILWDIDNKNDLEKYKTIMKGKNIYEKY